MDCNFLLQGIFPTQGSSLNLRSASLESSALAGRLFTAALPRNPHRLCGSCQVPERAPARSLGGSPGRQNWPWASPAAALGLVAQAKVCRPGSRGADRKVLHQSPGGRAGSLTTAGTAWSQIKLPSPDSVRPSLAVLLPRTLMAVPPGGLWVGRPAHGPQLELVELSRNTTLRPAVRWRPVGFLSEAQIGVSPYGLSAGKTVSGL